MSALPLQTALAALLFCCFFLQASALSFSVDFVNCTRLDWNVTLTQTDWSVASYVELFFVSTQGARGYSLLYSALNGGTFPTPGTYEKTTTFGQTVLSGTYRIGIGLTDMNGNILTTTATSGGSGGLVQVTALDPRNFTFGDCMAGMGTIAGSLSAAPVTTSSVASAASATATSAVSSTFSSVLPAPTSSSSAAPVASSLPASATSAVPSSHSGIHKGAIAGAVVGSLVALLIAFAFIRWCTSRRRTRRLSLAAARNMSTMNSPSSFEKQDGSVSAQHGRICEAPRVSFDAAVLGRLSEGSRRRPSESHTPYTATSSVGQSDEREIQGVQNPSPLSLAPEPHTISVSPYLDLTRTLSNPLPPLSLSVDNLALPIYPTDAPRSRSQQTHTHSRSTGIPRQISPTTPTFDLKSVRPSRSHSNFKIPRVSVPAYTAADSAGDAEMEGRGEGISRQSSRSRRGSVGGATFISMDHDPFVDAAQEQDAHEDEVELACG